MSKRGEKLAKDKCRKILDAEAKYKKDKDGDDDASGSHKDGKRVARDSTQMPKQ